VGKGGQGCKGKGARAVARVARAKVMARAARVLNIDATCVFIKLRC
jgi:hypothetical protein